MCSKDCPEQGISHLAHFPFPSPPGFPWFPFEASRSSAYLSSRWDLCLITNGYQWVPEILTRGYPHLLCKFIPLQGGQVARHNSTRSWQVLHFFLNGNHADCRMLGFNVELLWELDGISEPFCGSIFCFKTLRHFKTIHTGVTMRN